MPLSNKHTFFATFFQAKLLEASQITQNWMQSQAPSNGPNGAAAAAAAAGSNPRNNSPVPGECNHHHYDDTNDYSANL